MNIPTKVLRSTYITYETYFHHQQLAKKFYKSSSKTRKGLIKEIDFKLDSEFFADKQSIKEDLLKWYIYINLGFSLFLYKIVLKLYPLKTNGFLLWFSICISGLSMITR